MAQLSSALKIFLAREERHTVRGLLWCVSWCLLVSDVLSLISSLELIVDTGLSMLCTVGCFFFSFKDVFIYFRECMSGERGRGGREREFSS